MEERVIKMEKERYRILEQMEMVDVEDKPFDVKKYDYFLWLEPDSIRYAYNKIKFVATDVTDSVWVHFKVEDEGNIYLIIDSVIFEKGTWRWHVPTYYSIGDIFVMKPAINLIPGDTFYMTIYYSGKGSEDSITEDGINYFFKSITINAQPYGNRRWLPLYDRYYEKVDTVIATFKVPVEYTVVSNGVRIFDTTDGIYRYVRWIETYPIAPYLIAFFASKDIAEYMDTWTYGDMSMPVYLWMDTTMNFFLDITPDSLLSIIKWRLTFLSDRFGVYPFHREKYSEGFVCCAHCMEYQTAAYCILSLHEMIHQWWGDWVTAATHYGDVWLNEGFTTYFTSFFVNDDLSESLRHYKEMYLENYNNSVYLPIYGSGFVNAYKKGAFVLHMIRATMRQMVGDSVAGDSLFFDFIEYYGNRHAYSNVSTEDFKSDLEEFTGWDWDTFFLQWVYTPGHPVFDVRWRKWESGGLWNMEIVMNQIQDSSWMYYRMRYPIRIEFANTGAVDTVVDLSGTPSDTFYFSFMDEPDSLILDPMEDWLEEIANVVDESESIGVVRYGVWREGDRIIVRVPNRGDYRVEIYDISGRLRIKKAFNGSTGTIDDRIPSGIYIYRIVGGDGKSLKGKFLY